MKMDALFVNPVDGQNVDKSVLYDDPQYPNLGVYKRKTK